VIYGIKIKRYGKNGNLMILITGGLGYLGARIAKYLLDRGNKVRVATSRQNAFIPKELVGSEIVKIDLSAQKTLEVACDGVSIIIHLAGMDAKSCEKNPEQAILVNSLGTLNLLKAAKKSNIDRFIYFSTAHVYGKPLEGSFTEDTLPHPSHPYSITHRTAEDYVYEYSMAGHFSAVIFRLSNAVGCPISKDINCWMLVSNDLVRQLIINKKLQIYSNVYSERDFIAISDVCNAVNFMLKYDQLNHCEIYNLGSGCALNLKNLSELICDEAEKIIDRRPVVEFLHGSNNKSIHKLNYSVDKINGIGCHIGTNLNKEIKQLILMSQKWF